MHTKTVESQRVLPVVDEAVFFVKEEENIMPKNMKQEIIFAIMMVFVMVYGMVCYNIALEVGGMKNMVFAAALSELPIMCPIAFIIDLAFVGKIAKGITFKMFRPGKDNPIFIILSISICSVWMMCPLMSLAATILFKDGLHGQLIAIWIETTIKNFPMAFFWQLLVAGPLVRKIFGAFFAEKEIEAEAVMD